jgi:hypothetical protein
MSEGHQNRFHPHGSTDHIHHLQQERVAIEEDRYEVPEVLWVLGALPQVQQEHYTSVLGIVIVGNLVQSVKEQLHGGIHLGILGVVFVASEEEYGGVLVVTGALYIPTSAEG